jgi:hypothetical protein
MGKMADINSDDNKHKKQLAHAFEIESTGKWKRVSSIMNHETIEWDIRSAEGKKLDESCYDIKYEDVGTKSKEAYVKNNCDTTIVVSAKINSPGE